LPEDDLAATIGFVRLAVIAGAPVSLNAARDPRAALTIAQPVSQLLQQRWTYSLAQATTPQILGAHAGSRR
jgi:hypothetical protein